MRSPSAGQGDYVACSACHRPFTEGLGCCAKGNGVGYGLGGGKLGELVVAVNSKGGDTGGSTDGELVVREIAASESAGRGAGIG